MTTATLLELGQRPWPGQRFVVAPLLTVAHEGPRMEIPWPESPGAGVGRIPWSGAIRQLWWGIQTTTHHSGSCVTWGFLVNRPSRGRRSGQLANDLLRGRGCGTRTARHTAACSRREAAQATCTTMAPRAEGGGTGSPFSRIDSM
jgi:hypothetical protein